MELWEYTQFIVSYQEWDYINQSGSTLRGKRFQICTLQEGVFREEPNAGLPDSFPTETYLSYYLNKYGSNGWETIDIHRESKTEGMRYYKTIVCTLKRRRSG